MSIDLCGNPVVDDESIDEPLDELELFIMLISDYIESSSTDISRDLSKSTSNESIESTNDK